MLQESRGKNQPITGKLLFTFGVGAPSNNVTKFILVILIHLPTSPVLFQVAHNPMNGQDEMLIVPGVD